MVPRVKICCIKSAAEAAMAIAHGASAIGLVSAMPSGPGVISEDAIARIAATVPPPIATFLLTSEHSPQAIVVQQRRGRTHDWSLSRRIREAIGIPLFLAGGLNQANVAEAIVPVEPFGLDLCSSVR